MDIASAAGKTLGKEEFLRLFTNQLKYQDPLKPMDSTEFTAQLAQFSSLEQLFNISNGLEQMLSFQGSMNNGMTVGFIGRTVVAQDGVTGRVIGVEFDQNVATLVLEGGQKYPIGQISQIFETTI
ncbi:MAG: flagellar hook assembly protein FlgD [Nitrospirae bacterium]|nr:flagellar hook assembly protein FlgD [Nitrospirota bacterium]